MSNLRATRCLGQTGRARDLTGAAARCDHEAFSLVEVTIAIGIFAFVVVGILGLLPTGMRLRSEAAQESRAVLIQQELFDAVKASPSVTNVVFVRDGPAGQERNYLDLGGNPPGEDITREPVLVGYPAGTTVPYFVSAASREGTDLWSFWSNGVMPPGATDNDIQTIALLSATSLPGMTNVYEVSVRVRSPASIPLQRSTPTEFRTIIYSP